MMKPDVGFVKSTSRVQNTPKSKVNQHSAFEDCRAVITSTSETSNMTESLVSLSPSIDGGNTRPQSSVSKEGDRSIIMASKLKMSSKS